MELNLEGGPAVYVIAGLMLASSIPWTLMVVAFLLRGTPAKDAIRHYRMTSLMWLMLWPGLLHIFIGTAAGVAQGSLGWLLLLNPILQVLIWHRVYQDLRLGNHEHRFKDVGRRVRTRLMGRTECAPPTR